MSNITNNVTPRMRRVSRNAPAADEEEENDVTPRMRRVSRNVSAPMDNLYLDSHASHEACE